VLNANLVHEVAALLHLAPQAASIAHPTAGEGFALLCDGAIILTMPQCVIIICDMDVAVHRAVPALKTLIASHGFEIEWASFKRKNNGCPWGAKKDSSNVEEYAILKETFPAGNSFMFGAIDSDHYFDFIFDDLQRPTNESDVQCNIKLYGVEFDENFPKHVGSHLVTAGEPAARSRLSSSAKPCTRPFASSPLKPSAHDLVRDERGGLRSPAAPGCPDRCADAVPLHHHRAVGTATAVPTPSPRKGTTSPWTRRSSLATAARTARRTRSSTAT
jgi:hypothetical protein